MNLLKPKKIIQKIKYKKTELLGVPIKPATQRKETCWFYSIVNLIKHSPILRNNIAYSIAAHKNLNTAMNNAKNRPNVKNRCSEQELYYRTLKLVSGNVINNKNLVNFMNAVSKKVVHTAYIAPPRRPQKKSENQNSENQKKSEKKIVPRTTFENVKKQLLYSGATPTEQLRVFKRLLEKLKLPSDVISTTPKEGYKLAGSFLGFGIISENIWHAIIGTYNRFGRRIILNSSFPKHIYRINWTMPYKNYSEQFKSKWKTVPWSNYGNVNIVDAPIYIYVKKLY